MGRSADDAIPGWAQIAERVPVASAPAGATRAETVPLELPGRELWLSITGVSFAEGTVYAFRDLTEERVLEELRADFVSTVSHELRTPLAAIYGAALTLQREDLRLEGDQREKLLGMISGESDRLARTVNDILWASRLDADRLQVSIGSHDAEELTRTVIEAARVHLPAEIELSLSLEPDLPPVAADPDKVRQVLTNLVDNAIKYSPDGGPVGGRGHPARPRAVLQCPRRGPRDRPGRAAADLRQVLPGRPAPHPRRRRHRARALHLPRARAPDEREDLGRLARARRLALHVRAAGGLSHSRVALTW